MEYFLAVQHSAKTQPEFVKLPRKNEVPDSAQTKSDDNNCILNIERGARGSDTSFTFAILIVCKTRKRHTE